MASTEDVTLAYRLILDRAPENNDILIKQAKRYNSIAELGDAFWNSPELQHARPQHNRIGK